MGCVCAASGEAGKFFVLERRSLIRGVALVGNVLGFGHEEIMGMESGIFLEYHKEAVEIKEMEMKRR